MKYILGVDGGGTRTRALLVDETGKVHGYGMSGPANFHGVGIEQAVSNIRAAMTEALCAVAQSFATAPEDMGNGKGLTSAELANNGCIKNLQVVRVVLGLAGVGRPVDHAKILPHLQEAVCDLLRVEEMIDLNDLITLTTDAQIALAGAVGGEDGVVVIAGTGAIALGMCQGRMERAGGWGYLLDDRGSGYDLGREAIIAALRAFDGRGEETALQDMVCRHLQLAEITELVGPVHNGQLGRTHIGDLAKLVIVAAEKGDAVAKEILREGGRQLALMALAVARRLGLTGQFKVAGTGGILARQVAYLYPIFVEEIQREFPQALVGDADLEPIYGAVLLGAQQMNLNIQSMMRKWSDGDEVKPGEAD